MPLRDKIEHAIQNQPCTVKDLKAKFGGDRGADRKVMEALDQLVHEAVICQKQGVFFTVRSGRAEKALLCKVVKLGKNFAFVMLDDGTSDIFIPGRFTRGAMPGDEVLVEKFAHPRVEGSDEGEILAILTEKNDLVGTARRVDGRLKFVPDDCPAISMQLMRDCEGGAKDGDKVAVEILMRGNRQEDHRVGVAMRFGSWEAALETFCTGSVKPALTPLRASKRKIVQELYREQDRIVRAEMARRKQPRTLVWRADG